MDHQTARGPGLPAATTTFVGRRNEVAEVRRRLSTSRLVTLTGVGGVGKTRLAIEAARACARGVAERIAIVDLASLTDGSQLAAEIATALGVPDQSTRPPLHQLPDYLKDSRALIVLDNCDRLVAECAQVVDHLLAVCAQLRLLITSREALGVPGEQVMVVAPLAIPEATSSSPEALVQYDSVRLLVARAQSVLPSFAVTAENSAAIATLCARLEGLPLAIELAATRLRMMTVEDLVARLGDRFGVLTRGSRSAGARQQSLRAMVDWSYELCSPAAQRLWARLSVFAGGFDLSAVEWVCSDATEEADGVDLIDVVDELVGRSIVQFANGPTTARLQMLETMRDYGRWRLEESGLVDHFRDRHLQFYVDLAESLADGWFGPGQQVTLARLRADHANLRTALDWSTSTVDDAGKAARLVAALRYHWCANGLLSEGRRWLDRVLDRPISADGLRGTALWVAGWAALLQGDAVAAGLRLRECSRLAGTIGDATMGANAANFLALLTLFQGRAEEAAQQFDVVADQFRLVGDDGSLAFCLFLRAMAQAHTGDPQAADTATEVLRACQECGDIWLRSYAYWALAFEAWVRGDSETVIERSRAALTYQRSFDDPLGSALMIDLLAWGAAESGQLPLAGRLLGCLSTLWRQIGTSTAAFGPYHARCHARSERRISDGLRPTFVQDILAEGARWDHDQAIAHALGESPDRQAAEDADSAALHKLSEREREVSELVAKGLSNRQIASALTISPRTVDGHVAHILTKLNFNSRSQIAAWVAGRATPGGVDPQPIVRFATPVWRG